MSANPGACSRKRCARAVDALFAERLKEMRALIRGLSTFEFEQAVLSAYDTMRGAGVARGGNSRHFPAPPA